MDNKRSFAPQQDLTVHYTLNDIDLGKIKSTEEKPFTDSGTYANLDGTSILDTLNSALGAFSSTVSAQATQANSQAAVQQSQLELLQAQTQAQIAAQRAATIKKVVLPLGIISLLIIGGFVYYKYSKK